MQIWELKSKIESNDIPNLLILTGDERALMQIYVNQIESVMGRKKICVPSVMDAYNESLTRSLIDTGTKLLFVADDSKFKTEESEKIWDKLKSIKAKLIVTYSGTLDKRSKFYKQFEDNIVYFDKMKEDMLVNVLSATLPIKSDYLKWLAQSCNNDYGRCLLELDKVSVFNLSDKEEMNKMFLSFAKSGVFHSDIPDCVFDFTNAVMKRDVRETFLILDDLKRRGDNPIQVLGLLYNNFRNLLSVQMATQLTSASIGLEERQINAIKWNKGKYTDYELMDAVQLIAELDRSIKIGTITDALALDYFIVRTI